jgi:hypothetical protein
MKKAKRESDPLEVLIKLSREAIPGGYCTHGEVVRRF